jgi:hypothetical protein
MLTPGTGSAQVEIGPRIGLYIPVGALIHEGSLSNPSSLSEKRLQTAALLGAEAVFWATKRLGVAASVALAPSPVAVTDSFGTHDRAGAVILTDARLLVPFTPIQALWSFYLGAGAAVASRTGSVWQSYSGATSPAFLASVGVRYGLRPSPSPAPRIALRMELTDYISRAQFDKGLPTETTARSHQDFTFSFMVAVPIIR